MSKRPGRRAYLLVAGFAFLLVLLPFLFWYSTWFGRKLTDSDIQQYLHDASKPRRTQHALVQIGERLARGDRGASRWYPDVVSAAASPRIELRQTAAWIMGQDHTYAPFHDSLVKLLQDPEPMVQRNAALALANFRDPAALPELRTMLRPFTVASPDAGEVHYRLKQGEVVNPGTLIARVGTTEVRAPLPGEVRSLEQAEGAKIAVGAPLADIGVDKDHAWEALRALYVIGSREDIDDVRRFARGVPGMPARVQQQAAITLAAIEQRNR